MYVCVFLSFSYWFVILFLNLTSRIRFVFKRSKWFLLFHALVCMYVCVCVCFLLLRDDGGGGFAGCGRRCRRGRLAGPFRLLLLDPLLDQIVSDVDGIRGTGDGDDAVPGTRREDALLRDLDVGTGQVLDLDQAATGRT